MAVYHYNQGHSTKHEFCCIVVNICVGGSANIVTWARLQCSWQMLTGRTPLQERWGSKYLRRIRSCNPNREIKLKRQLTADKHARSTLLLSSASIYKHNIVQFAAAINHASIPCDNKTIGMKSEWKKRWNCSETLKGETSKAKDLTREIIKQHQKEKQTALMLHERQTWFLS